MRALHSRGKVQHGRGLFTSSTYGPGSEQKKPHLLHALWAAMAQLAEAIRGITGTA